MAGPIRISVLMDAGKAKQEIDQTGSKLSRFASGLGKVGLPIAGIGIGIAKLGGGLLDLAKGASEDDAAQKILARTLKNTAGATDATVASVEDYISKAGVATGVTDDEMRPALASLVRATKDVGKAQTLMNLAMDVSAGTGKDLGAVSTALAKAQNGSVGGLAKLGIATKDAAGKTKTFAQIQKDLAKTFGGQAGEAANSTAGKYKRFQLVMDELGETIGGGVLPVLGFIANIMLTKVFPAAAKVSDVFESRVVPKLKEFGAFVGSTVVPKLKELGGFITGTLVPALQRMAGFVAQNKDFFVPFVAALAGIVTGIKIWTIAQAALNVVLSINPVGLVVIAIAALIAGVIFAYKHSEKFRGVVQGLWSGLQAFAGFVTGTVVPAVVSLAQGAMEIARVVFGKVAAAVAANKPVLDRVKVAFAAVGALLLQVGRWAVGTLIPALQKVGGFIASIMLPVLSRLAKVGFATVVISIQTAIHVVGGLISIFARVVTAVSTGVPKIVGFISGLPGKILGAIGRLGGLLRDAGASLISGLISGMTSKLDALRSKASEIAGAIKGFFPGSPVKEGPLRSWNGGGAGSRLVDLLVQGMGQGVPTVRSTAAQLATGVTGGFGTPSMVPDAAPATAGLSGGVVNLYLTVQAGIGDPVAIGREVKDALVAYESFNGAGWRSVP